MKKSIRALRQAAKLSQAELASKLGYQSNAIVAMWEAGDRNPPSAKLPALAQALNCSIDDLFADDQNSSR